MYDKQHVFPIDTDITRINKSVHVGEDNAIV